MSDMRCKAAQAAWILLVAMALWLHLWSTKKHSSRPVLSIGSVREKMAWGIG